MCSHERVSTLEPFDSEYLDGEYSTVEAIIEKLAEVLNEKAKASALYRNLRMNGQRVPSKLPLIVYC